MNANTFVEHNDHLLLYYTATPYPHGWSINTDFTQRTDIPLDAQSNSTNIMIARIRKDRFASLASGFRGTVSLDGGPRDEGDTLYINARSPQRGIRAAVTDLNTGKPLAGFAFDDCVPFVGDATRAAVKFRSAKLADLPAATPLMVHFEISSGEVFGYEWAR